MYIEREKAIKMAVEIIEIAEENNDITIIDIPSGWESIEDYVQEVYSDIPSADVVSLDEYERMVDCYSNKINDMAERSFRCPYARKYGEWIEDKERFSPSTVYRCSVCGEYRVNKDADFCTNCGADMRGGGAE